MILGVDYGKRKIGLAISDLKSKLAEPYRVIRCVNSKDAVEKISKVVKEEGIEKIIVGISEGTMASETKKFTEELKSATNSEVEFYDETLSTKSAQEKSIAAGMKRKKRKEKEDAFAAAIILQDYLEHKEY